MRGPKAVRDGLSRELGGFLIPGLLHLEDRGLLTMDDEHGYGMKYTMHWQRVFREDKIGSAFDIEVAWWLVLRMENVS